MPAFTINKFSGSIPRQAAHLGQKTAASYALDCAFETGNLESFREPLAYRTVAEDTNCTYQQDCCWHDFKGCCDLAYGSVLCKQTFVTGLEDYPIVITVSQDEEGNCVTSQRRLGLPCPTTAPSTVLGDHDDSADRDQEGRSYCYQYVNDSGERSQLSPGSTAEQVYDGQSIVVSGWTEPDEEWGVTKVALYRSVSGYMQGTEGANNNEVTWMLVDELEITETSYTDTKWNYELYVAAAEEPVMPPPDNLRGIIWVERTNSLMGYVGNRIYASENNNYHNWPYYYDLDDNVCGLVESGGEIYVATDGHPYVLAGVVGCDTAGCREVYRLRGAFPMVGCGNRRMAAVTAGAVFPSHRGLVFMSGKATPTYITWPLYTEKQWQALVPQSITPVEVDGKLYVFGKGGSFYMQLTRGAENNWTLDHHCSLSDVNVTDAFISRQGDFYIVKDGIQYRWNKGPKLRPHLYRSIEAVTDNPVGWGAGILHYRGGTESIKVELDGRSILDRDVYSSRVFRLPMHAVGQRLVVTLSGTGTVDLVSIATTMQELKGS